MEEVNKPNSPAWRNPRDVSRRHLLRRKSSRSLHAPLNAAASASGSPSAQLEFETVGNEPSTVAAPCTPTLSRNPYKSSVSLKRPSTTSNDPAPDWDDSTANDSFSSPLLNSLQGNTSKRRALLRAQSFGQDALTDLFPVDFSGNSFGSLTAPTGGQDIEERTSQELPVDMRLGTKMRIVSRKPFPWIKATKGTGNVIVRILGPDKHEGMKIFLAQNTASSSSRIVSSPLCLLEAASLYWQYPSLPWMDFFPRAESLTKNLFRGSHLPKEHQEIISTQWSDCFDQLYLSWKKGDRKDFYVCSSLFTVLFTKSADSENPSIDPLEDSLSQSCFAPPNGERHVAIVSHTNYYVRQLFKKEGINFELVRQKGGRLSKGGGELSPMGENSMMGNAFEDLTASQPPLLDFGGVSRTHTSPVKRDDGESGGKGEGEESEDEDPDENSPTKALMETVEWAQRSGISPRRAKKWTRHASLDNFGVRNLDDKKPNSVIVRDWKSLQALFNVVQTDRCVRSMSGVLAGLPPTLLSSQPFVHAQLHSLKKSSQYFSRGSDMEYSLELDGGPIMPHHITTMTQYIQRSGLSDGSPVIIRINDRSTSNGLNSTGDKANEWTEMRMEDGKFHWKVQSLVESKTNS